VDFMLGTPPASLAIAVPRRALPAQVQRSTPPAATAIPLPDAPPPLVLPPATPNRVPVGLLLPLSGPNGAIGRSMLRAAQLALFDVADRKFVLLPRDTGGTEEGARRAVEDALVSGARLLLGPVFSSAVRGAGPVARGVSINLIAFTNDSAETGNGVFAIGIAPGDKINRVVSFAVSQGNRRLAALFPAGPFGDLLSAGFEAAADRAGGTVVRIERYERTLESMTEAVKRIGDYPARRVALLARRRALEKQNDPIAKRALKRLEKRDALGDVDFDAVLVPESGEAVKALASLLLYYEIDLRRVQVLGIDDWSPRALRREPALEGAWYTGAPPSGVNKFIARYRAIYKSAPHALAALAYDGVALAALLVRRSSGPTFDPAALTDLNWFAGEAGLFRLLPSGVAKRRFAIMQVIPEAAEVISPPPPIFEDLNNPDHVRGSEAGRRLEDQLATDGGNP
jgi:ABC-type branched-subunit amino acid transport system substrate-binding protein